MKCLLLLIMFVIPLGPIPSSFQTKDDPQMESAGAKGAVREVAIKNPSPAVAIREIRGLKDEDWIANLQFEAENKSGRPLYYVSAKLRFPGIVWKETGRNLGFGVSQGDDNFRDLRQKATSDARAITPGETFVLRISEHVAKGLRPFFEERNFTPEQSSNIEFYWDTVNFGEGTGLMSGYLPYPDPAATRVGCTPPCARIGIDPSWYCSYPYCKEDYPTFDPQAPCRTIDWLDYPCWDPQLGFYRPCSDYFFFPCI